MSDQSTTVAALRQIVNQFVDQREWQPFHNPKNLAMSLAIEAAELMEHFQWLTLDESSQQLVDPDEREAICDEVADCLAYVLAIANRMQIDLSRELQRKMEKNAIKYPLESSRGRHQPPGKGNR